MNDRKPNRLAGYDYSQPGAYFITICTRDKAKILSSIVPVGADTPNNTQPTPVGSSIARPPVVGLSPIGVIVEKGIKNIEQHYDGVFVDNYVIMPNHIHLIIRIDNACGRAMLVPTVSRIIQQFKGYVTKQVGRSIWQYKFYDHIIRDDGDYAVKFQYIDDNPAKWAEDKYFE